MLKYISSLLLYQKIKYVIKGNHLNTSHKSEEINPLSLQKKEKKETKPWEI